MEISNSEVHVLYELFESQVLLPVCTSSGLTLNKHVAESLTSTNLKMDVSLTWEQEK